MGEPTAQDAAFLERAVAEAQRGASEGGVPVGSVLVVDGRVVGAGRNRSMQLGSVIRHAETDALENAGLLPVEAYRRATLYTTLSPCCMCAGAILWYRIGRVVVGDSQTFRGAETLLEGHGVELVRLESAICGDLLTAFIERHQEHWDAIAFGADPCG